MFTEILQSQLSDIFRAGLVFGLIYTMLRTRATTGTLIPLAAGVVFIAAVLPMTTSVGAGVPLAWAIGVGLVSNCILLAIGLGLWTLAQRFMAARG